MLAKSTPPDAADGRAELFEALITGRKLLLAVLLFSLFVNILMLTGPIFMLQVYDRVLASGSVPTLLVLFGLVAALYLAMGLLDYVRARVLARVGARFQSQLDARVFSVTLRANSGDAQTDEATNSGLRDLESIQRMLSGPAPFAFFDAPWAPFYLVLIFFFHPLLGWLAIAGGVVLILLTGLNEWLLRGPQARTLQSQGRADQFAHTARRDAETLRGLGMVRSATQRWLRDRAASLRDQIHASDRRLIFSTSSKTLRYFLQSAMLALGAGLAIQQEITPGIMIAASILLGRALAPVEQAIAQWPILQRAHQGWRNLSLVLAHTPRTAAPLPLPNPGGTLTVNDAAIGAPGAVEPTVTGLNFTLQPGQILGVFGPSGAGKTTLARALVGLWPPVDGDIRLDGATFDQWSEEALGRAIGYLPQDVVLFDGSVAENIARLEDDAAPNAIIHAAQLAGAHELILALPYGYDTPLGAGGQQLSGGERQRIALARALYGDPVLIVLDEPNANLDQGGDQALNRALMALKNADKAVVVISHRRGILDLCDQVLHLEKGHQAAFGPPSTVGLQNQAHAPGAVRREFRPIIKSES